MRRPKRVLSLVGMAAAALSFTRIAVLVLESLAVVNDERQQDQELIALCRQGAARGSAKMRSACLQAQADAASPIILKTITRSLSVAWTEFASSVSTPWGLATVLLFCVSSLFLPVLPMLKAVLAAFETRRRRPKLLRNDDDDDDDDDNNPAHIIMLPGTLRRRVHSEIEEL